MASKNNPILHFSRVEHKYFIPNHLTNEIALYCSKKGQLDRPNAGGKPYTIYSVYFDSPGLDFFWDKIEGYPHRQKVRVRFYGDPTRAGKECFLEIKNKTWERILKDRTVVGGDFLDQCMDGLDCVDGEAAVFQKVACLNRKYLLKPKVVIRYKRISFLDPMVNFKISIDTDIQTALAESIADTRAYQSVFEGHSVVEMKYDQMIPVYAINLIQKYGLAREAISKYCYSVAKLYNK